MASNTENLGLLKKNPSTDGADTFNIQTMLNDNWDKLDANAGTVAQTLANILKPTTPPLIGLPPSTTPDGMFQALGNTGELHVWRKTVTTAQEIPAKYELESAKETLISTRAEYGGGTQRIIVEYASSCSVSESGDPYLVNSSSAVLEATSSTTITSLNNLKGKFLKFSKDSSYQYVTVIDGIFFIPSDATFRLESGPYRIFADKAQKVTGYAKVPAGTTTTYPVSTNPNAYQEGNDAKPAWYTLGEVVTGSFSITPKNNGSQDTRWNYAADATGNITVSDDGVVSLSKFDSSVITNGGNSNAVSTFSVLKGKYATFAYSMNAGNNKADLEGMVVFFPNDAVFSQVSDRVVVDRYQPVTGYAAIPAGTTIEYLGKLGDKARVQVVSYVGTGTYGSDHPNSLTFDRAPRLVLVKESSSGSIAFFAPGNNASQSLPGTSSSNRLSVTWSNNNKTMSWRGESASVQLNQSGRKYTVIVIYG